MKAAVLESAPGDLVIVHGDHDMPGRGGRLVQEPPLTQQMVVSAVGDGDDDLSHGRPRG